MEIQVNKNKTTVKLTNEESQRDILEEITKRAMNLYENYRKPLFVIMSKEKFTILCKQLLSLYPEHYRTASQLLDAEELTINLPNIINGKVQIYVIQTYPAYLSVGYNLGMMYKDLIEGKDLQLSKITNPKIDWIVNYLIEEDFSTKHIDAIAHIIGLFNDCEESEKEIFDFAEQLYKKYAE